MCLGHTYDVLLLFFIDMNETRWKDRKKISKVDISGIRWPRHTIQTLKCRYKSKLSTWDSTFAVAFIVFSSRGKAHSPLSRFPGGELSSVYFTTHCILRALFSVNNSSRTLERTQTNNISKHAAWSDSGCYYFSNQKINLSHHKTQKTAINFP